MLRALEDYISTLNDLDALVSRLLLPPIQNADLSFLSQWPSVEIRNDLQHFFARVPGYSAEQSRREELKIPDAPFTIRNTGFVPYQSPVGLASLPEEMELRQIFFDPVDGIPGNRYDYVGIGFVPFLTDHNGSYEFVNCDPKSPTFGAIYTLFEGIGSVRVAADLEQYFKACHQLLLDGVYFLNERGELNVRIEDETEAWNKITGITSSNGDPDW